MNFNEWFHTQSRELQDKILESFEEAMRWKGWCDHHNPHYNKNCDYFVKRAANLCAFNGCEIEEYT